MEANTRTEIKNLLIGDRFYLVKDRNRTLHTKVQGKPFVTKYYTYTHYSRADGAPHPDRHKDNTLVHFLRHV